MLTRLEISRYGLGAPAPSCYCLGVTMAMTATTAMMMMMLMLMLMMMVMRMARMMTTMMMIPMPCFFGECSPACVSWEVGLHVCWRREGIITLNRTRNPNYSSLEETIP